MDHLLIEETIDEMTNTLARLNSTHSNGATPRTTLAPAPELRRATTTNPPRTSQYSISPGGLSPVSPSVSDNGNFPWVGATSPDVDPYYGGSTGYASGYSGGYGRAVSTTGSMLSDVATGPTPSPHNNYYHRPRRPSRASTSTSNTASYAYPHPGTRVSIGSGHTSHRRSSSTTSTASYVPGSNSPFPAPSKPLPTLPPITAGLPRTPSSQSPSTSQRVVSSHSQPSSSDKSSLDVDRFSQSSETSSSHPSRSSMHSISLRPAPLQPRPPLAVLSPPPPPPPSASAPPGAAPATATSSRATTAQKWVAAKAGITTTAAPIVPSPPAGEKPAALAVDLWKSLSPEKKRRTPPKGITVFYLDISATGTTIAIKHGNSQIKFWNVETGTLQASVKFSAYTEAHCRSRDYLIRSHAILSDTAKLAAIATRFGRDVEIWNWERKKKLQLIENVDRWAAGRFESYEGGWSPIAAYRGGDSAQIDLYAATDRAKKPFAKVRTIDLNRARLPFVPQYPELALSPTSPLLVAAAGPRTPRAGHPPPDRETLLIVWEIDDYRDISHEPHRMVRPWQHTELDTAIPCNLATHGQLVVSIWIPASHRVVPRPSTTVVGRMEWKLTPVAVPFKHVLVWDLSENSTRSFGIPNTTACVSPDCRFVAYCDGGETLPTPADGEAEGDDDSSKRPRRGKKLAVVDASTGEELWSVGTASGSVGSQDGAGMIEQFGDISTVTNMEFSADARFIALGYSDGNTAVFDVRELIAK